LVSLCLMAVSLVSVPCPGLNAITASPYQSNLSPFVTIFWCDAKALRQQTAASPAFARLAKIRLKIRIDKALPQERANSVAG